MPVFSPVHPCHCYGPRPLPFMQVGSDASCGKVMVFFIYLFFKNREGLPYVAQAVLEFDM